MASKYNVFFIAAHTW